MSLPGPFLAGQRLTAGQLNDATQKTLDSVAISASGAMVTTVGATEANIPKYALGPVPLVDGGLYRIWIRGLFTTTVASDSFTIIIRRDTALTGPIIAELAMAPQEDTTGLAFTVTDYSDLPSVLDEPAVSFFFSMKRFAGTGTASAQGMLVGRVIQPGSLIERVGYASEYRVVP